jgi:hypothetical protein
MEYAQGYYIHEEEIIGFMSSQEMFRQSLMEEEEGKSL